MVAAKETNLKGLLEGSKQYQVPLYQRVYSWEKDQWQRLWDDVVQLAEDRQVNPEATHFIGSLVLAPSPLFSPVGVATFLVVDGQQRLTTLTLLLAAIRDYRHENEQGDHQERINDNYLINRYEEGKPTKLLPTQADRDSYFACIRNTAMKGGADQVGAAYRFFKAQLAHVDDPDDELDIKRLEEAVTVGLTLVAVTAQHGDNVHRIFESLNNTGLKLTQGDLVRNYLFMRMPTKAEEVYQDDWLPLQKLLNSKQLELLFWIDLVRSDDTVNQADTYAGQQARLERIHDEDGIVADLKRVVDLGHLLYVVLNPEKEEDPQVRQRLQRLNSWGTSTVIPLLVTLLDSRARGDASSEEIAQAMLYIESYIVRRVLSYKATAGLNRVLLRAVVEIQGKTPVDAVLRTYLSTGRRYWATDAEILEAATTIPLYYSGRKAQQKLILLWLEESFASKERVDAKKLTIEHVLPQTPTGHWQEMLAMDIPAGEDFESVHASVVHTLGNLTLSGYNSELSNKPWEWKKAELEKSGLRLNHEIVQQATWSLPQIHQRGRELAQKAVALWPGPDPAAAKVVEETKWTRLSQVLAEIPAGAWTTYGDVAAVVGTHPVPLGQRLATHPAPNAHRVLQSEGTISPGFRWLDPECTDDPRAMLEAEGVRFGVDGKADLNQRLSAADLAELCGLGSGEVDLEAALSSALLSSPEKMQAFRTQLVQKQEQAVADAVFEVLLAWAESGGTLAFGDAAETSCFLMARTSDDARGSLWPAAIYPSGKFEVVFEHISSREPFDQSSVRLEFLNRLNEADGVDLSEAKLELRPGFPLSALSASSSRTAVIEALVWFRNKAVEAVE